MWLKAMAKLLGLPQYVVRAGEPQPLWAAGSELLNINSPVLYHCPCCDPHLLFCKGKAVQPGWVLRAHRCVPRGRDDVERPSPTCQVGCRCMGKGGQCHAKAFSEQKCERHRRDVITCSQGNFLSNVHHLMVGLCPWSECLTSIIQPR